MTSCCKVGRDLRPLFDPRSVAIVGASDDPAKWGHLLAAGALEGEHRRAVYLVNRRGGEVLGRPVHRSVVDLPEAPELVVLTVPAAGFEEAVRESLAAGAAALIGITAGLGESGEEGRARERALVAEVRARRARLLGPNCMGVFDAEAELHLAAWRTFPRGEIGLISQSGNLALEISLLAEEAGVGFSRFASIGNQADLDVAELVSAFAGHEPTKVIALYCEDFRDGRAFVEAAGDAAKPVVLLSAGGSTAGSRAARSHTGALVSAESAVEAACRAAHVLRVRTPAELIDAAQALLTRRLPGGRRVAIVGDGGGHGVLAADRATEARLELPQLSDELSLRLAEVLPPTAATRNPVDFAGGGEQDVRSFERVIRPLLASGEVDSVLLTGYFGGYGEELGELRARENQVAAALTEACAASERPLFVHTMYSRSAPATTLREGGVPVYRTIESAVSSLARLVEHALAPSHRSVPPLPEQAEPVTGMPDYWTARDLVASAEIAFPEARRVRTLAEAQAAAAEIGFPVVLKATTLLHKSDQGGVALGIASAEELDRAFEQMPPAARRDLSVEQEAPLADGVELIVGVRRDVRFGPVALVGLGGLYAELLSDVAVALAPVDEDEAESLLRSLHGAPLLLGSRGRPAVDLATAARAAAALSRVAASHPEIAELEINPLLVTPAGALGLDARMVLREDGEDSAS